MKKIPFLIDYTTNQETQRHGNSDLPIGVYHFHLSSYEAGYTPWHWHKEVELYFVLEGAIRLNTTSGRFILKENEAVLSIQTAFILCTPTNVGTLYFNPLFLIHLLFQAAFLSYLMKNIYTRC